jgi:hypothetical protein
MQGGVYVHAQLNANDKSIVQQQHREWGCRQKMQGERDGGHFRAWNHDGEVGLLRCASADRG